MNQTNPYNTYKQNEVNTATQNKLLLMLLDGAVKYTKIARLAIMDKNINKAHSELVRVQNIFIELMSTLDTSVGGWTTDIYDVYDFIRQELMKANIKKDAEILDKLLPLIEQIRDLWYEVDENAR
ncbi:flagellar export chaperone FliS [Metaclostridioides mangenotii]|jgi:flagellar protein FliS|uniref:Flagellar protein FliS n=1 Tax=Metaclostridioides mangenotii TaxID=1540 RepID=A0ABS4ECJ5_9FIRM|nr:flagellar export chaperone FliS [Clostridioides mangenotii]MBP1855661.1 flagellar protein FliS [Clostridioides mangenotii]